MTTDSGIDRRSFLAGAAATATTWALAPAIAATPERTAIWDSTLPHFAGESIRGVDVSTMRGKVVAGYQGWFNVEGDGAQLGWRHWTKARGDFAPGNAKIDIWPDVSELAAGERFATGFRHADGSVAEVFSSFRRETVLRHFQWMRDYGIDGAFVQRFAADLRDPRVLRHGNTVLAHCRAGAHATGRSYCVMYDLSGLGATRMDEVHEDWQALASRLQPAGDRAYQRHGGRPLVAVWGVGFGDNRKYTLAECRGFIEQLKRDGCAVMLGVPTHWRELKNDAAANPALHEVLQLADIVSPWTVGRYRDIAGAERYGGKIAAPDIAWCRERKLDFLPVLFPGFSWHNMHGGALDAIPRQQGRFLWAQAAAAIKAGAEMLYVAMFDEVDEGTAIFKCVDTVPASGGSAFIGLEGLPSDHYLRLTGRIAQMLRGEIALSPAP